MLISMPFSPLYAVPFLYMIVEMIGYLRFNGVPYRMALFQLKPQSPLPVISEDTPTEGCSPRIRYRRVNQALHLRARGWVMLFGFFGLARIVPDGQTSKVFFSPFPSVLSWIVSVTINLVLFVMFGSDLPWFAFPLQLVIYFASVGTFFFFQRLFVRSVLLPDLERVLVATTQETGAVRS